MRLNLLTVFLLIVLVFLQYRLWRGPGSVYNLLAVKRTLETQIKENEALRKQNEELLFQVERSKNSLDAAESRARGELGMIKKNEKFYQIVTEQ
jgi:cell division protein FtsB